MSILHYSCSGCGRENGYEVRLYDIIPVIGFGGH